MTLLLFSTESCTQCKAIKRELEGIAYERCNDYDKYDIMSVPTLIILDGDSLDGKGKEVGRLTGFHTKKQIQDWVNNIINEVIVPNQ